METIVLQRYKNEEISEKIRLIGETAYRGSHPMNTLKGKRLFEEFIPEFCREDANKLISMCKRYYKTGIPETVEMTVQEDLILSMLEIYCSQL